MLWLLYILARYIENLFYYILIDEYTPEHTIMITTEILLRFFLVLVLTALLSDVSSNIGAVRAGFLRVRSEGE